MNPIKKAIQEVTFEIPKEILGLVFRENTVSYRNTPISLEEQITNKVIRSRVMVDCDLVGGDEVFIPLDGVPSETMDNLSTVYYIPKTKTQNRTINSVLSMSYSTNTSAAAGSAALGYNQCSVTPSLQIGQAMMDAHMPIPMVSTAKIQLIGENTVLVRDSTPVAGAGYLRCILSNDEAMSHLQMRSILAFCELVVLACKAYIYNEYIVTLDKGQIYAGQNLGVVSQIIEGYSDANELYKTYRKQVWAKVAFMNDTESMQRFIKLQVGSMR